MGAPQGIQHFGWRSGVVGPSKRHLLSHAGRRGTRGSPGCVLAPKHQAAHPAVWKPGPEQPQRGGTQCLRLGTANLAASSRCPEPRPCRKVPFPGTLALMCGEAGTGCLSFLDISRGSGPCPEDGAPSRWAAQGASGCWLGAAAPGLARQGHLCWVLRAAAGIRAPLGLCLPLLILLPAAWTAARSGGGAASRRLPWCRSVCEGFFVPVPGTVFSRRRLRSGAAGEAPQASPQPRPRETISHPVPAQGTGCLLAETPSPE